MSDKIRVILVTDGDRAAQHVVEMIADSLGLRCISASGGNPTPISGEEIVHLLQQVKHDPVMVMFDDRGRRDKGKGEAAMEYVASHPTVQVLGAVAVASNTTGCAGIEVTECITAKGEFVKRKIDKDGTVSGKSQGNPVVSGDTVDILNELDVPVIIGIGDVGKMDKADDIRRGAPITRKAVEEILRYHDIVFPVIMAEQCNE